MARYKEGGIESVERFKREWAEIDIPEMLVDLGEDLSREGLEETPKRVAKAWREMLRGYEMDPRELLSKTFDNDGTGIQLCRNIEFVSLCEHHLLSFFGYVSIAYMPNERVVGLSKLARLVECFSCRLQIQERLVEQMNAVIAEVLEPDFVVVLASAKHLCCVGRGVKAYSMEFETYATHGDVPNWVTPQLLRI